ncbi:MAG: T9SS type A sorting domain-containing protein [Bacteroidetes bacterium]|nr:T9SS type A sorting domain-containing protein [Bacteroidota bacterium]
MKKKGNARLLTITLMFFSTLIFAANTKVEINKTDKTVLQITVNTPQKLAFIANYGEISIESVKTDLGNYSRLNIAKYGKSNVEGSPELPVFRRLIQMPLNSYPVVNITSFKEKEYNLNDLGISTQIIPLQPSQPKCGSTKQFDLNNLIYDSDEFVGYGLVNIDQVGVLRAANIGRIAISPVRYNPVTNTIKVIYDIEFTVTFKDCDITFTEELRNKTRSPYFEGIYSRLANNQYGTRNYLTTYPVHYVIVSDRMFESQLQPFIEWKKRKGFTISEAYTDVIGTSLQQIKGYIKDLYDNGTTENPAPSFVLFVGDISQIPAWNNGDGVTDRNYVEYTGDLFPEIFYGRFSANNASQLQPYIDKTLMYEQYTMPNPTYLDTVLLVSGVDGSYAQDWGNGQINYGTINYFNDDHDIYSHTYLYPASGSASAAIKQNVSEGVTFGNYTAHCSSNGWADPSFVISDIPGLTNQDKYGLLIGNCCSSSEFQVTCFAEEILRAANKGCVGYIGGSNSTYWNEDYYFGVGVGTISENPPSYEETTLGNYDRSFHDHGEEYSDWFTTMDQMVFAGNLAVSESGSSLEQYYWDIYNLMGDPSLNIYFSNPEVNPVVHDPYIMIGATSLTINAAPYSYVALNNNGENIISAITDENGDVILEFESFTTPGFAELVVTAQNYQPYIESIQIFAPDGPFCIYENHSINDDSLGNGNGNADFDEYLFINLSMINYGNEAAYDVNVTLTTTCDDVLITDDVDIFDTININQPVSHENSFLIHLSDSIEDQTTIIFDIMAVDNEGKEWDSQFEVLANAPKLTPDILMVDDAFTGNNNGRLDPGETATLKIKTMNTGHCVAYNVKADLISYNPYITVLSSDTIISVLSTFGAVYPEFEVVVSDDAPEGILAEMRYQLTSAGYFVEQIYYPKVGTFLEDWETGDFSKFDWKSDGNQPWSINTLYPYEGFYDVVSGDILDNQSTEFFIQYEVMSLDSISFYKKVSSESDFDFLQFYIDNELKGEWSGNNASWTREAYIVSPGDRKFRWVYIKDYSATGGVDKAWIDYIELPLMMTTTVYAGPDNSVCENTSFQCQGTATNFDSVYWSTSGTGSFNNTSYLNAIYTPSDGDILAGSSMLTLNIIDVDGVYVCDTMTLTYSYLPFETAIPIGPEIIDLQLITQSNYNTNPVYGAEYYSWKVFPTEAGSITGSDTVGIVTWNPNHEGDVWISCVGMNNCGSGSTIDSLMVEVGNYMGVYEPPSEYISIIPNPNNGNFTIMGFAGNNLETLITIYNMLGEIVSVYENKSEITELNIDLSDLHSGIYLVEIKNSNQKITKKVIIEND